MSTRVTDTKIIKTRCKPTPKRGPGRKTKLTPAIQSQIIEAIEGGNYACVACALAGISEPTYYSWIEKGKAGKAPYAEFLKSLEAAEAKAEADRVKTIVTECDGDGHMSLEFLRRRFPERWGNRDTVDNKHDGTIKVLLTVSDTDGDGDNPKAD